MQTFAAAAAVLKTTKSPCPTTAPVDLPAPGDILAPLGDGEDENGRVLANSRARFVVVGAWTDRDGVARVNLRCVRGAGIYRRGDRVTEARVDGFAAA